MELVFLQLSTKMATLINHLLAHHLASNDSVPSALPYVLSVLQNERAIVNCEAEEGLGGPVLHRCVGRLAAWESFAGCTERCHRSWGSWSVVWSPQQLPLHPAQLSSTLELSELLRAAHCHLRDVEPS